ncbi:MAG: putative ParA family partition protein [Tardiphaga sp.]|uniref:ParA family protein n=1 Tax=Tardiphaga sp. TaxID=1926292 RepID=UPI002612DB48|nr:ParA family protein [Tardiphaga sp.]MDB5500620.1 putative ParA family partition protein [Tardiphaga sp.]
MQTIVLATQKGGSGKSTLAIGLALAAMQDGHTVRLIETDPQGTLSNWKRRRAEAEPSVEPVAAACEIEQRLEIFDRNGVTLTVIDTAGGVSDLTTAAIRAADLCLIPVRPSLIDLEAAAPTLRLARSCNTAFGFVLNQTPVRGQRLDNASTALDEGAPLQSISALAQPCIVMRNDHQDALGRGLAVGEFAPSGKSAEEIRGLWQWVSNRLGPVARADAQGVVFDANAPDTVPTMFPLGRTEETATVPEDSTLDRR